MEEVGVQDAEDRVDLVPPIRKRKILTEEQRVEVISMSAEGLSNLAIAKQMKVSHQSIGTILQRWNTCRLVRDRKRSGRRRKTDRRTDQRMVRIATKNRTITADEIRKSIDVPVSLTTVRSRLNEGGLKSRFATKKPLITEINRKK
jgi:transposase